MTVDEQIKETIQQIGGIFISKGVAAAPVNLEYLEEKVAPGMEKLVITELIMHLEDLLIEYIETEQKVHKFSRYVQSFRNSLDGNSEGGVLIGRAI